MTTPIVDGGGGVRRGLSPADSVRTTPAPDTDAASSERYDLQEVQQTFSREYQRARDYIDSEVGPVRAQATRYYLGQPFGNEEVGRSQVISRDVRDTVINYLPSTMRVLFGGEKVVEYVPVRAEDVALAEQATDYVNLVVVRQDNDGFLETYAAVKDALVRKVGFLKWWWDTSTTITGQQYSGLDEQALQVLATDPEVEELRVTRNDDDPTATSFSATCVRKTSKGLARFAAVPPEELLINREARSFRDARAVFHRRTMVLNDLVAMGYQLDSLLDHAQSSTSLEGNQEALARTISGGSYGDSGASDLMRRVLYVEGYLYLEVEGRELATLHKVCCAGEQGEVLTLTNGELAIEEIDGFPFAALCPDPEPHTFFGTCPADLTMDTQEIKSNIQRGMLDSLGLSINPRTEVVEGQVNLHDLMNPEVNRIIRVRAPGMIRESITPFLGGDCLPVLGYYDQVIQQRTKQNDASQGLDADALQSTSKAGITATINAAQAQQELTARLLAEGGIRDLFRGLLRLLCQHQDKARMVRLRDTWVAIDPRQWNAEMDVSVNVALGSGSNEDKMMALREIKATQEQIFATLGNTNPLVTPGQYRASLAKLTEMGGFRDAGMFFSAIPADFQAPESPPAEDPAKILAGVQMAELNLKAEIEAEKLKLEREKMEMTDELERFKATLTAQVQTELANHKAGMEMKQAELDAMIAHAQMLSDEDSATKQKAMDHGSQVHLKDMDHAHEQQMQSMQASQPQETGETE